MSQTCNALPPFRASVLEEYPISITESEAWSHKSTTVAMGTGSVKMALQLTEIALKIDPHCSSAWIIQGQFLYDLGRYEEALVSLRQGFLHTRNPNDRQVARSYIDRCQEILDMPVLSLLDEARETLENDQNERAERLFRQALEVCPNSAKAKLGLGVALMEQGALEASIEQFDRGIEQDPTSAPLWFHRGLALFYSSVLDKGEALASFTRALELDEDDYRAQNMVAECLRLQGRYDKARRGFERSLTLNPESGVALMGLAMLLTDLGQPEKALSYIDQGVTLYPRNPAHWEIRGNVLAALGRDRESVKCYMLAMTLDPNLVPRLMKKIQDQE